LRRARSPQPFVAKAGGEPPEFGDRERDRGYERRR
jgi:hypothetical protein